MSAGTHHYLFAVIKRFRYLLFQIRIGLFTAVIVLSVAGADALAQDSTELDSAGIRPAAPSSVLDAPILGGDPDLPDVTYVRAAIHPIGAENEVRIALDVHLAADPEPDSLFFPVRGLHVDSVLVDGRVVTLSRGPARLAVPVASDSISSAPETDAGPGERNGERVEDTGGDTDQTIHGEIRMTLFYVVESGLNRRTDEDDPIAVWTSPGGVDAHWLPLPSASDDLFNADLAVSLPGDWTFVRPLSDANQVNEERTDRPESDADTLRIHLLRPLETVTAHDLGFAVVRTDMLRSGLSERDAAAGDATQGATIRDIVSVGTGILDRPADSVRIEIDHAVDFLADTLGLSVATDALTHLLIGGSPGGPVGSGVTVHGDEWPRAHAPWIADFQASESIMGSVVGPSLVRIPTTDIWIRQAIVSWLSALYVQSVQGEAAFADIMEQIGTEYFAESRAYRRPLVWDRWSHPIDLLDAHARGKGAWILHMIESMVGRDAVLAGLDEYLDLPDDRLRDSEALRESIEAYSDEDLSSFFDAWVYGAGHPVLDVSTSHDAAGEQFSVRVEQVQEGALVPAVFPMRPGVRFASIEGVRNEQLEVDDAVTTASFRASIAPTYFHVDTAATWLFEYATPPPDDDLVSRLRHDESPASRVRTYRTLSNGEADSGLLFGARPVITGETDPIARALGLDLPAAMAPAASAERLLLEYVQDASPIVRARALRNLLPFDSQAVGEAALRAANSESNPLVLAAAVPVLIARRPAIAWDVIESALVTASPGHRVRLTALGQLALVDHQDRERVTTLLEHTGPGQPFALRRTAAIEAARIFPGEAGVARLADRWLAAEQAILRWTALDMLDMLPPDVVSDTIDGSSSVDPDPHVRRGLQASRTASDSG